MTDPTTDTSGAGSRRSSKLLSYGLQFVGIAVAGGALYWCVRLAMDPKNQEALAKLRAITPGQASLLAGLTVLSFILNGLCFWATVRPRHTIKPLDMIATNFLGCLLAEVPFKLSAIFRVFIHNRRDGVPLLTIGAWFAAFGVALLLVVGPLTALSLWRKDLDAVWLAGVLLGIPLASAVAMNAARHFSGPAGMARMLTWAGRLPGHAVRTLAAKVLRSHAFGQLHAGFDMVASRYFVLGLFLRGADVLLQAGRFFAVARILDVDVSFSHSLFLSGSYFLIGVVAPSGSAGSREGGVTAVGKLLAIPAWQAIAPVALTVGACELIVLIAAAPVAMWILKPWKLRSSTPSA